MKVPTIAVDFDGVINTYAGWEGADKEYAPREGVGSFLITLHESGWKIIIHTCRPRLDVRRWLKKHELTTYIHSVTNTKPIATIYLDDRGLQFTGDFKQALYDIANFTVHWKEKP